METPKDKAIELCVKFFKPSVFKYEEKQYAVDEESAKKCALICVDEMLEFAYNIEWEKKEDALSKMKFLKEVKQEIKKL